MGLGHRPSLLEAIAEDPCLHILQTVSNQPEVLSPKAAGQPQAMRSTTFAVLGQRFGAQQIHHRC